MRIIALMIVRDEDWCIRSSLRAALKWCDGAMVVMDRCTDRTAEIVDKVLSKQEKPAVGVGVRPEGEHWDEMEVREFSLTKGREMGGTHFAVVDADEILTGNLLGEVRGWFGALTPGRCLDLPMIAPYDGLDRYRTEDSEWTRAHITLGFADSPNLAWAPRGEEKYQHHARAPRGEVLPRMRPTLPPSGGGVFHLQWASRARLLAKHKWYAAMELVRWPQYGAAKINWRYSAALKREGVVTSPVPPIWWIGVDRDGIDLTQKKFWWEEETERMIHEKGRDYFRGLGILDLEA